MLLFGLCCTSCSAYDRVYELLPRSYADAGFLEIYCMYICMLSCVIYDVSNYATPLPVSSMIPFHIANSCTFHIIVISSVIAYQPRNYMSKCWTKMMGNISMKSPALNQHLTLPYGALICVLSRVVNGFTRSYIVNHEPTIDGRYFQPLIIH